MSDKVIDLKEAKGRVPRIKARVVGKDLSIQSNVLAQDENRIESEFAELGALSPPLDPETLCVLYENSNSLRPNVDAYVVNIDGFGHRYEPVVDLGAEDAAEQISNAMYLEAMHRAEAEGKKPDDVAVLFPDEEAIEAKRKELEHQMRREKSLLESFFAFCCTDESFISLRRRTRQDREVTGNAYWELVRNKAGRVSRLKLVPSFSVRLLPLDAEHTEVMEQVRISELGYDSIKSRRRFRKFVQTVDNRSVYYKEFGDPRVMSSKTGRIYKTETKLTANEEGVRPATEILHFEIYNSRSAYGMPRWTGALLSVLGSREAEEINQAYFENKSVPPLAILVSGGRLSEESISSLEDYIETEIKGKGNFHKIMLLEADPDAAEHSAVPKIDMKPLTGAQQQDALFQRYDERNVDKVGMAFRLPRLLRGDIRDFNRATALASLQFAESQVFEPERNEFDWVINRKLLPDMGIRLWRFRSNGPIKRDPAVVTENVRRLVDSGVLTPAEGRILVADVFSQELPSITADWVKQPLKLTLAGIPVEHPEDRKDETVEQEPDESETVKRVAHLVRMSRLVREVEDELDREEEP